VSFQLIIILFGILITITGIILFIKGIGSGSDSRIKIGSFELTTKTNSLMIIVAGISLIIFHEINTNSNSSNSKDTATEKPVLSNVLSIKGFVSLVSNERPLANVVIMPAFSRPKTISDERGYFNFNEVPMEEIEDSFKLSFFYRDTFVNAKKFPTHSLQKPIQVYLNLNPDNLIAYHPNVENSFVIDAVHRSDNIIDSSTLINEISIAMVTTKRLYDDYDKNPSPDKALELYEMNKKTTDLLLKNNQAVPIALRNSSDSILQHMQIWSAAYEKANKDSFNSKSTILLKQESNKFPKRSVEMMRSFKR
jgi:hypothetical protein